MLDAVDAVRELLQNLLDHLFKICGGSGGKSNISVEKYDDAYAFRKK